MEKLSPREQYKKQSRETRIANSSIGLVIGKIIKGEHKPTFDNSAIWALRNSIAKEVAPEIVKTQKAWAAQYPTETV